MLNDIVKIGCRQVGPDRNPRWIIHNNKHPEEYWTGDIWTPASSRAKLFIDRNLAYLKAKKLQELNLSGLPKQVYTVKLTLEVRGDPSLKELKEYCYNAANFEFDYDLYGCGPENSHVCGIIDWDSMRRGRK